MGLYIKIKSRAAFWIGDQIKIYNTSHKHVTLLIIAPETLPIKREPHGDNEDSEEQTKSIKKLQLRDDGKSPRRADDQRLAGRKQSGD